MLNLGTFLCNTAPVKSVKGGYQAGTASCSFSTLNLLRHGHSKVLGFVCGRNAAEFFHHARPVFSGLEAGRSRVAAFSPQADAFETEKGYQVEVALPGMKREEIKVDFHQGRLTISGERQFKNEQNDRRYHLVESAYGSFHRSFQLPDTVEPRQIQAQFEDGVLHVMVPKDEQKAMRHQIQVQGAQSGGQLTDRMGQ